jgi:hypothetical protein
VKTKSSRSQRISTMPSSDLLQCRVFRHVVLDILHEIDLRKAGHKAPTYRQTEQCSHLQKSKLHADSNGIATRWLRVVLKLLLHRGCVRLQAPITVRDLSSEVRRGWKQLIGRKLAILRPEKAGPGECP